MKNDSPQAPAEKKRNADCFVQDQTGRIVKRAPLKAKKVTLTSAKSAVQNVLSRKAA